jgi:hypothetical protein
VLKFLFISHSSPRFFLSVNLFVNKTVLLIKNLSVKLPVGGFDMSVFWLSVYILVGKYVLSVKVYVGDSTCRCCGYVGVLAVGVFDCR